MTKHLAIAYFGDTHGTLEGDKITGLGGFDRLKTAILQFKKEHPYSLVLFGGDLLGQTSFSTQFKGQADIELLNQMQIDAFVLGNHDFHNHLSGLKQLMSWADPNIAFLAANIETKHESEIQPYIKPYKIFNISDMKIAVIGVVTNEVKNIGDQFLGKLIFQPIVKSIRQAISQAKKEGAELIILLSHLGFDEDNDIASDLLQDGDVIILGNHAHLALGNLPKKYFGLTSGPFPLTLQAHHHQAFITTASYHGQLLAILEIEYIVNQNENSILACTGKQIIIDNAIKPDPQAKKIIEYYRNKLDPDLNTFIAHAEVDLIGLNCFPYAKQLSGITRREETPLTNLVADAVYHAAKLEVEVDFALIHAGSIRHDIKAGRITIEDIYQLLPYQHQIIILPLTGAAIKQALEHGVYTHNYHRRATFLIGSCQLYYEYDIHKPINARVSHIMIGEKALQMEQVYLVAINNFMLNMKIMFNTPSVFASTPINERILLNLTDREALLHYFKQQSAVITGRIDNRILCIDGSLLQTIAPLAASTEKYRTAIRSLKAKQYLSTNNFPTKNNINKK